MIRACLLLLAGLYAPQLISFDLDSDLVRAVFVAAFCCALIRALRPAGWVLLGFALFSYAALSVVQSRLAPDLSGDSIMVDVRVADFAHVSGETVTFIAEPQMDSRIPPRIRLSWFAPPVDVQIGDRWRLELRLRRPRGAANPGAFDVEAWLFRKSIGAVGYVVNSRRNQLLETGPVAVVDRFRQGFLERLGMAVDGPAEGAVLAALVVGARHLLGEEQWDRYARTGISHLMAISGLHIGLAASGGYLLCCAALGVARFGGNQHIVAIVVALGIAVVYALVSGLAIPARRAAMMLCLAALIIVRRRRLLAMRVVALVCVTIAAFAPLATMAPGFMLSFGAVSALTWIARRRRFPVRRSGPSVSGCFAATRTLCNLQLALLCGLLPLTAVLFGRIAIAAPIVNLFAVPLFSFVTVPFALLGLAFDGPLRPLGDGLLSVAAYAIELTEQVVRWTAAWGWSAVDVPLVQGVVWLYIVLPVCWVLLPPGWPGRSIAWAAVLGLLLHMPASPRAGCVDARVLDVGQGLAVLVRTRSSTLLYDTGPKYRNGRSAADAVILPLLTRLRVDKLDYLVVSHSDNDHAGGTQAVLDGPVVDDLIVGEALVGVDRRQRRCDSHLQWAIDEVEFRILHPEPGSLLQGNDASCVLQITAGSTGLLLTGDIEQAGEDRMLNSGLLQSVDVVTVPHHGSRTSSTEAFVTRLRPGLAIVANAFGNRWGFPKPDVAARWLEAGAELLQTATSGAIGIRFCADSDELQVQRHRAVRHRIWHE